MAASRPGASLVARSETKGDVEGGAGRERRSSVEATATSLNGTRVREGEPPGTVAGAVPGREGEVAQARKRGTRI